MWRGQILFLFLHAAWGRGGPFCVLLLVALFLDAALLLVALFLIGHDSACRLLFAFGFVHFLVVPCRVSGTPDSLYGKVFKADEMWSLQI